MNVIAGSATQTVFKGAEDWPTHCLGEVGGLKIHLLDNGGIYAVRHGQTLINQALGCPLSGGMNRLFLRRRDQQTIEHHLLTGPHADSRFAVNEQAAVWSGQWSGAAYCVTLTIDAEQLAWFWTIDCVNNTDQPIAIDALYGQDIGLADTTAVRINEAYNSHYLDHQAHRHPTFGWTILSRQNQAQAHGRRPWLMHGCFAGAESYATDGFQFFDASYKTNNQAKAALQANLPSQVLQYEFAYAAMQSPIKQLQPGERTSITFAAQYQPDHAAPSSVDDLKSLDQIASTFTPPDVAELASALQPASIAQNMFHDPAMLEVEDLNETDMDTLFGADRRHVETLGDQTLSFFYAKHNHVVLRAKEQRMQRPHGHILRSSNRIDPDPEAMCSTVYAYGLFGAQTTLGNTRFHQFTATARNPLNIIKTAGQRIFIETDQGWRLLATPSAFDIGLDHCRWIYKTTDGLLIVSTWADPNEPAILTRIDLLDGVKRRFLFSHGLALGGGDCKPGGKMVIDPSRPRMSFYPSPDELIAMRRPQATWRLVTPDAQLVEDYGGDALLFDDHQLRDYPFAVMRTRPTQSFTLALTGALTGDPQADRLARLFEQPQSFPSHVFYARLIASASLAHSDARVARLNETIAWFGYNALIHFASPHGLEQANGAAWGVRDLCQGPIEFLLTVGQRQLAADAIKHVFSHQYQSQGDWPQWFMLDDYHDIQQSHCHGDILIWPLKAVCDYIEATNDTTILEEQTCYTDRTSAAYTQQRASIAEHIILLIKRIESQMIDEICLIRYGDGDWNDTLQPVDPALRTRMASAWTAALLYQTLRRYAAVCARVGDHAMQQRLDDLAARMRKDFNQHLIRDGVLGGFGVFDQPGAAPRLLLHPGDETTGVHYRLLPMTRSILAELFDKPQAEAHMQLIREKLLFPDGVRLMDRPPAYQGGVETCFKRAEISANFGREVGLMYLHAHLRYIESLAKMGLAEPLLHALTAANPVLRQLAVPNADLMQANAYFSSSDADFATRYEASKRFDELRAGQIKVKGGWRIYSSGPGIFLSLLMRHWLGVRDYFDDVVIDPVLPASLDGLQFFREYEGRHVVFIYHVSETGAAVERLRINGRKIEAVGRANNPYRSGGLRLSKAEFVAQLNREVNQADVFI